MHKDFCLSAFNRFNDYSSPYTFRLWHSKLECFWMEPQSSPIRMMPFRLKPVMLPGSPNLYLLSKAIRNILLRHCYGYLMILASVAQSRAIFATYLGGKLASGSSLLTMYIAYPPLKESSKIDILLQKHPVYAFSLKI